MEITVVKRKRDGMLEGILNIDTCGQGFYISYTENNREIEDVVYYNFNIFIQPLEHFFPRLSVFVSQKLEFLCRSKFKWIATSFIVKAKKKLSNSA